MGRNALNDMINNGEIRLDQYFTMHPFSATEKLVYDKALQDVDFFNAFYIKSNKTYERLATICSVINNVSKNLIVITGYRGCGKTNFLHLIKRVFDGYHDYENINETRMADIKLAPRMAEIDKQMRENYKRTYEKLRTTLPNQLYQCEDEQIGERLNSCINTLFCGTCEYINFDIGGMGREKPFSNKIFYLLRESIERNNKTGKLYEIVELISGFIARNKWKISEHFEYIDYSTLITFLSEAKEKINNEIIDDCYTWMKVNLTRITLEQLLFIYSIWEYAEIVISEDCSANGKLIYILDNIDIISDDITDIFRNTMMGIWKFIWDTRNFFDSIKNNNCILDEKFIKLYEKTKFIVAMRETTAMHISGHLRDKMRALMEHFDMSVDVDKTNILQRKIDYATTLIDDHSISNPIFIEGISLMKNLIMDRLLMKPFFLLFNDDYRTAALTLTTICIEHQDEVKTAINLVKSNDNSIIFGGRGIIYRLIIDAFFNWNYFRGLGVKSKNDSNSSINLQSKYAFSCARIILTILCNKQVKVPERFFINPEESVRLLDLYSFIEGMIDLDDFVNVINEMFSLRDKKYWNHLVTFDNILTYSPSVVKQYLQNPPITGDMNAENHDIYIRATSAGQTYIDTICIHFEFFSSRFGSTDAKSLFMFDDLHNNQTWNTTKRLLNDVYNAVSDCCRNLERYNRLILNRQKKNKYYEIIESPYYYEAQFHEERIIHNHISYIEAFRHYVLTKRIGYERKKEVNSYLISVIKQYLNLLKLETMDGISEYRDVFISKNSQILYNELSFCIEQIENTDNIDTNIEITRRFYRAHYSGSLCRYFKKYGFKGD